MSAAYPGCWDATPDRDYDTCNSCRQEKRLPPIRSDALCEHHAKLQELESRRQMLGSGIVHVNRPQGQRFPQNNSRNSPQSEPQRYRSLRALT